MKHLPKILIVCGDCDEVDDACNSENEAQSQDDSQPRKVLSLINII